MSIKWPFLTTFAYGSEIKIDLRILLPFFVIITAVLIAAVFFFHFNTYWTMVLSIGCGLAMSAYYLQATKNS